MRIGWLVVVSGIALAAMEVPQKAPPPERFDEVVRADFFAGLAGNEASLEKAMKVCEERLARNPKDAPAMVWHGGGLFYRAGLAFRNGDTLKGIDLRDRGLKEMNEAVSLRPDDVQVLIPRAAILLGGARFAPEDRSRPQLEKAMADYEKVLKLQEPFFTEQSTHSRGELLGELADGWRRLGNQDKLRSYLERIIRDLPGTAYEKKARGWLENPNGISREDRFCLGCHVK